MLLNDGRFIRAFTELIEETNSRGILTQDVIAEATARIRAYFAHGEPLGQRMFKATVGLPGQWLVKYSKRKYVDEMYKYGRFRISPASEYAKGSHIKAVKDLETARHFKLKAIKEALEGVESFFVQDVEVKISHGVVPIQVVMGDYYLFCTCKEIDRKLPTDFEADAALVIKDRKSFVERLKAALSVAMPDWEFLEGEVYYFDPYNDVPRQRDLEFWKPFSYAYQKEHRCVLRPRKPAGGVHPLVPIFVELGSLSEIAEVVLAD